MRQTLSKLCMNDMVTVDTIVFEIVLGGSFKAPPPRSLTFSNTTDRIGLILVDMSSMDTIFLLNSNSL